VKEQFTGSAGVQKRLGAPTRERKNQQINQGGQRIDSTKLEGVKKKTQEGVDQGKRMPGREKRVRAAIQVEQNCGAK